MRHLPVLRGVRVLGLHVEFLLDAAFRVRLRILLRRAEHHHGHRVLDSVRVVCLWEMLRARPLHAQGDGVFGFGCRGIEGHAQRGDKVLLQRCSRSRLSLEDGERDMHGRDERVYGAPERLHRDRADRLGVVGESALTKDVDEALGCLRHEGLLRRLPKLAVAKAHTRHVVRLRGCRLGRKLLDGERADEAVRLREPLGTEPGRRPRESAPLQRRLRASHRRVRKARKHPVPQLCNLLLERAHCCPRLRRRPRRLERLSQPIQSRLRPHLFRRNVALDRGVHRRRQRLALLNPVSHLPRRAVPEELGCRRDVIRAGDGQSLRLEARRARRGVSRRHERQPSLNLGEAVYNSLEVHQHHFFSLRRHLTLHRAILNALWNWWLRHGHPHFIESRRWLRAALEHATHPHRRATKTDERIAPAERYAPPKVRSLPRFPAF
mmetsp:Transcript_15063/g.49400  ORF Transcript_15063/g.49400 Transcript_15063/m.49400 type:complete len:436 (-) Transcript_15063:380-1687(-)